MTVYAQPAIKGSVLDERKTALTGATILLRQAADSQVVLTTISDSAGYFRFPKVNPGKYLLQVSFITYLTTTIPLRVESQPLPPIEIILRPDQQSLQGVTVRGRKPGITVTAGKTTMNVESSPLAQSQSAFDLLKDLPGVTITKEGEIKIRGRSGVTVMIDGEPVEMGSTQLKNMLSATPGSTLQAMEVLNNPPSSMDAAGNGGVINIKFKKRTQKGFNGNIASGIGWGRYFKTDHSITLSKGTDQWNLNGTYAIDIDRMWQRDSIHRPVTASGNPFTMQQVLLSPQRTTSHLAKLSVDRYLGKQHTIGLTLTYNQFTNPINGTANTRFFEKPSVIDSLLYQQNNIRNTYTNLDGILKYRFKISDHHAFSTSFQATRLETKGREEFNVQTILPGAGTRPAFRYRNIYPGTVDRYSFRADYTQDYVPIGAKSGKFEMGIKATQANTRNSQEAANMIRDKWEADISRNNRFRYRERILAAYTSMEVTWPQWELKGGLRGEQTGISGDSLNGPRLVKQNYLSLFPNLQVGYKFSDHYKLSVSYNRRIDRPEYDKLNPAVRYLDLYTIETGNPYLKPQFSDNFELSQQLFDFIDITAGYSLIKNPLYYTFIPSQGSQEAKYTTINAGKQRQWSAALSFPIPLAKWWENYQTFYFYSSRFNANLDNQVFREKANSFGMSTYNSFQLPAGFSMELNGWYESGGLYGNFLYKPMAELSLGLNKKFFNDKLSAGIAVNDVFYTSMFRANMINKREGNSYLDSRTDSRIVKLTLNWRFGKKPATAADKKVDETDADRLPDGRSKQAIKKPGMQ
jgi:hypothetical protein